MAPDALPVAANHAALSNRISMLLASQSSILKTLNPSSSSRKPNISKTATVNHAKTQAEIDDEELFKNSARPNEGVGYIPPKSGAAADKTKEDRELRGRILGKRGAQMAAERQKMQQRKKKKKEEESDDEDLGRSALGKRKRPRREVELEVETKPEARSEPDVKEEPEVKKEEQMDVDPVDVEMKTEVKEEEPAPAAATKRKKNKKKKNKSKTTTA